MARERRRQRARTDGKTQWMAIAAIVVMGTLIVGAMGSYFIYYHAAVRPDKVTLCPATGATNVHAILVDNSDPLTEVQKLRLTQTITGVAQEAAIGERVDLFLLTAGGGVVAKPEVSLCRPPDTGNPINENPGRIHKRFEINFLEPVLAAIKRVETPHEAPNSPIMASIKAVCIAAFGTLKHGTHPSLTIASDMIENSPTLNQYRRYDTDAFLRGPKLAEVLADCHGAAVNILYLTRPRDAARQTVQHQNFWERLFDRMNATLMRIERV